MRLYSYWRSTAAYRVRIVLNLKALAYETIHVNLLDAPDSQARIEYQKQNPQGLVPTLIDDGLVLTQSTAIVEYLEARYPEPPLLPDAAADAARVRALAQLVACDIHPLNNLRVLHYLRSELLASDDSVNAWYQYWVAQGFSAMEQLVTGTRGDFCFGDQVSIADVYLAPQMYNANRFNCDVRSYPNLVEICEGLAALPAFASAAPEEVRPV